MEWVARENLLGVDRMLAEPDPAATLRIKLLGRDQASLLLRYQANEQNRYCYEIWETAQVVLAALFFFFLLFGTTEGKTSLGLALLLMILVLTQRFLLTPEINAMGRLLDFGAGAPGNPARLNVTQYMYTAVEMTKWGLEVILAALLIGRGRLRSSDNRQFAVPGARSAPRFDR